MTRSTSTFTDVTCPFCGLLCDDLTIEGGGAVTRVTGAGCARANAGFGQQFAGEPTATLAGRPATLDEAIAGAVDLLRHADAPLVGGMAADAAGCRAALALAEKAGATVDHTHGAAFAANVQVMQRRGWIMTTLTEVRNRADVVLLFGTDGNSVAPRFAERCLVPPVAMGRAPKGGRRVFHVGPPGQGRDLKRMVSDLTLVSCKPQDYVELLWSLRAHLAGKPGLARSRSTAVKGLAAALRGASYAVIAWAPGQLPAPHADTIIETLCEMVAELNGHTRAAGLAMGGQDGLATAASVCAWQTGYPLRVGFAGGVPRYDPVGNDAQRLIERGQVDALLWISAFQPLPPPAGVRPVIALTPPSRRIAALADVHIAVAIPGVEKSGTLFRMDNVVALPLRAVRATEVPAVAEVLNRIRAGLQGPC